LLANGGVSGWRIFEFDQVMGDNVTCAMTDPFVFIGKRGDNKPLSKAQADSQLAYHSQSKHRVSSMGTLTSAEGVASDEFIIVFNSKTVKGALRYLREDPLVKSGDILLDEAGLSPINVQDTDGLHHYMARSFAEARELDQIHFLDPLDVLEVEVRPLKCLPNHAQQNSQVVATLKAEAGNRVPKYIRHNWLERFGSIEMYQDEDVFRELSVDAQMTRLTVSDSVSDDGDAILEVSDSSSEEVESE